MLDYFESPSLLCSSLPQYSYQTKGCAHEVVTLTPVQCGILLVNLVQKESDEIEHHVDVQWGSVATIDY